MALALALASCLWILTRPGSSPPALGTQAAVRGVQKPCSGGQTEPPAPPDGSRPFNESPFSCGPGHGEDWSGVRWGVSRRMIWCACLSCQFSGSRTGHAGRPVPRPGFLGQPASRRSFWGSWTFKETQNGRLQGGGWLKAAVCRRGCLRPVEQADEGRPCLVAPCPPGPWAGAVGPNYRHTQPGSAAPSGRDRRNTAILRSWKMTLSRMWRGVLAFQELFVSVRVQSARFQGFGGL